MKEVRMNRSHVVLMQSTADAIYQMMKPFGGLQTTPVHRGVEWQDFVISRYRYLDNARFIRIRGMVSLMRHDAHITQVEGLQRASIFAPGSATRKTSWCIDQLEVSFSIYKWGCEEHLRHLFKDEDLFLGRLQRKEY